MNYKLLCAAMTVAGLMAGGHAHAAVTWTFTAGTSNTQGGNTATATAYTNKTGLGSVTPNLATLALNSGAPIAYTGGLGINNGMSATFDPNESTAPEHAIDNNSTNNPTDGSTIAANSAIYDTILLSFTSAVKLTGLNIGYKGFDSDITIAAYTGAAATPPLAGLTYAQLASNGWGYVEHEADVAVDTTPADGVSRTFNGATVGSTNPDSLAAGSTQVASKYWLIMAYNPTIGAGINTSSGTVDVGNDFFKLYSVSATTVTAPPGPGGRAPEPTSLALLAVAAVGATAAARGRKRVK